MVKVAVGVVLTMICVIGFMVVFFLVLLVQRDAAGAAWDSKEKDFEASFYGPLACPGGLHT